MTIFFIVLLHGQPHIILKGFISFCVCVCVLGGIGGWWKIAFQLGFRSLPHSPGPEVLGHVN